MKTLKKIFPVALLLALAAVSCLSLYSYHAAPLSWSVEENRALAATPQLSATAILDGVTSSQPNSFIRIISFHVHGC